MQYSLANGFKQFTVAVSTTTVTVKPSKENVISWGLICNKPFAINAEGETVDVSNYFSADAIIELPMGKAFNVKANDTGVLTYYEFYK